MEILPILNILLTLIVLFSVMSLAFHVIDGRPEKGLARLVWHLLGAFFTAAGIEAGTLLLVIHQPVWINDHQWWLVAVYAGVTMVMASWLVVRLFARRRPGIQPPSAGAST